MDAAAARPRSPTVSPGAAAGAPPSTEIAVNGPVAPGRRHPRERVRARRRSTLTGPLLQPPGSPGSESRGGVASTRKVAVRTGEGTPAPETATTRA